MATLSSLVGVAVNECTELTKWMRASQRITIVEHSFLTYFMSCCSAPSRTYRTVHDIFYMTAINLTISLLCQETRNRAPLTDSLHSLTERGTWIIRVHPRTEDSARLRAETNSFNVTCRMRSRVDSPLWTTRETLARRQIVQHGACQDLFTPSSWTRWKIIIIIIINVVSDENILLSEQHAERPFLQVSQSVEQSQMNLFLGLSAISQPRTASSASGSYTIFPNPPLFYVWITASQ